jgi:hypothetical protein
MRVEHGVALGLASALGMSGALALLHSTAPPQWSARVTAQGRDPIACVWQMDEGAVRFRAFAGSATLRLGRAHGIRVGCGDTADPQVHVAISLLRDGWPAGRSVGPGQTAPFSAPAYVEGG